MLNLILIDKSRPAAVFLLAALFVLVICLPARAEKGSMQIGLCSRYAWPQMDVDELEPNISYGLIFHYWLNDTTTVVAGYEQFRFLGPLELDNEDDEIIWSTGVIELGVRYRPELDFVIRPFAELGVGYQLWQTDPPDVIASRSGGTMAYLAGVGADYEIRHAVTAALGVRYHYMPMREKLEREVVTIGTDDYDAEYTKLEDTGYLSAGVELVWRFK